MLWQCFITKLLMSNYLIIFSLFLVFRNVLDYTFILWFCARAQSRNIRVICSVLQSQRATYLSLSLLSNHETSMSFYRIVWYNQQFKKYILKVALVWLFTSLLLCFLIQVVQYIFYNAKYIVKTKYPIYEICK